MPNYIRDLWCFCCFIMLWLTPPALGAKGVPRQARPTLPLYLSFLDTQSNLNGEYPALIKGRKRSPQPKSIHVKIKAPDGTLWRHTFRRYKKHRARFGGFVMDGVRIQPKRWFRGKGVYVFRVGMNKSSWTTRFGVTGHEQHLNIVAFWSKGSTFLYQVERHHKLSSSIHAQFKAVDQEGKVHVLIHNKSKRILYSSPDFWLLDGFVDKKTTHGWAPAHGANHPEGVLQINPDQSIRISEPLYNDVPVRPRGRYRFVKRVGWVHPLYHKKNVIDVQTVSVEFSL